MNSRLSHPTPLQPLPAPPWPSFSREGIGEEKGNAVNIKHVKKSLRVSRVNVIYYPYTPSPPRCMVTSTLWPLTMKTCTLEPSQGETCHSHSLPPPSLDYKYFIKTLLWLLIIYHLTFNFLRLATTTGHNNRWLRHVGMYSHSHPWSARHTLLSAAGCLSGACILVLSLGAALPAASNSHTSTYNSIFDVLSFNIHLTLLILEEYWRMYVP